jgi:LmbE family N-acetylglucosaminyl deacetylase
MLWERRIVETLESARLLGVQRVEFLGYVDSGMMGEPTNDFPYSFWQADVEHAATRLAAILAEEDADILTVYDDFGGYGHPDHIQVHRVGLRAAELAGVDEVYQGTMNADHIRRTIQAVRAQQEADGVEPPEGAPTEEDLDTTTFGKPEVELTHAVDVADVLAVKRASMMAHESQIAPDSWFLSMDEESFAMAFGTEWFIRTGHPRAADAPFATSLWDAV